MNHTTEYCKCRQAYGNEIIHCSELTKFHSFDFQQVVAIPHLPQQPDAWYYWFLFKLYVFGLVDEKAIPVQHYHTVFTEAQHGKGANLLK